MITYYQFRHKAYGVCQNRRTKKWEAWQLAYIPQPLTEGRVIATARLRHHLYRKIHQQKETKC